MVGLYVKSFVSFNYDLRNYSGWGKWSLIFWDVQVTPTLANTADLKGWWDCTIKKWIYIYIEQHIVKVDMISI